MESKDSLKLSRTENSAVPQTGESGNRAAACLKANLLTILTLSGVIAGGILGYLLRELRGEKWPERELMYIGFLGELFLSMLKSLILPLIVSSLISAIAHLDLSLSGKIARRAIVFYMTTTFCAVVIGIMLVVAISPGTRGDHSTVNQAKHTRSVTSVDTLLDLIRNLFPPNLIQACTQQTRTVLHRPSDNTSNIYEWEISRENVEGMNILGLVVFSTALGITLAKMGPQGKALAELFGCLAEAMMIITRWVIWLSPIGVLFLVSSKILEVEDFQDLIGRLGMYFITVIIGLVIQGLIIIPFIYFVITKKNPFIYITNMVQALATAFGTSSSSASLPVTIRCLEENSHIDSRIVRFALPIGATINMDGTALYEAVAAIFIAQIRNVDLSIGNLIVISITATAASIGAAGIPQAGLVTMVMVLDTVGLPAEDITLIIAVDWLLDRFRTVINVMGDAFGAGIVDHLSKSELKQMETSAGDGASDVVP